MISLYMDEHVPRAITIGLRLRGVDVLSVQEDNFAGKSDSELLDRAIYLNKAIFTHDVDHLIEATKRQRGGQVFYGKIYAHHLRVSIGTCIKDLELLAKFCEVEEIKNQVSGSLTYGKAEWKRRRQSEEDEIWVMEIGKSVYDWLVSAMQNSKIDLSELNQEVVTREAVTVEQ